MASTYSTNLGIELITTGEQAGTWGTTTNLNLGTLIEQAISGYVTQAISDVADTVITIPDGATGVARNMFIEMTSAGALTATRNLIVPADRKLYFIYNNTSGGFAVTVKVTGLTGVSVPNGRKVILVCNGTDIVEAHNAVSGNATVGGTLVVTGATTLTGAATLSSTLGVTGAATLSSTLAVTGGSFDAVTISGSSANSKGMRFQNSAASSKNYNIGSSGGGPSPAGSFFIYDDTASAARLVIDTSGSVGIGTTTPSTALQVNGTATATTFSGAGTSLTGTAASLTAGNATTAAALTNGGTLNTPGSGTLTNCTFPTLNQNTTGNAATATTSAALTNGGTLNTPGSGTLTNCTGLPIVAGTTGTLSVARGGTGVTGSTGSGSVVLSTSPSLTSPSLTSPALGTPSSGNLSNCTNLPIVSLTAGVTGTLPVANGGTGVTSNTGSGSVVLSASPTFSGTAAFATITSSGNITAGGNLIANGGFVQSGNAAGVYTDFRYDGDISGYGGWTGVTIGGDLNVVGALSKGSGSFKILHPLPEKTDTHYLVHSFIEGPKADLIYSGMVRLVSGYAHINIDAVSGMTAGTFEVLCRDVRRSTTNESGFSKIRSEFYGSSLHIYAESQDCVDEIFWQVIGERKDPHMYDTGWTDDEGHVITEPMRDIEKERKREADYEARRQSLLASNNS